MRFLKLSTVSFIVFLLFSCALSPKPIQEGELLKIIEKDRKTMYEGQEPVSGPLTLEEAMARALLYNLDHRLKLMEDALSLKQFDLMKYDMLPRIVASAGYNARDEWNAASSQNVFTGLESLAPSTSMDKRHSSVDLTLTWSILDFGVSYFQARQQADRALIMAERRRKVVHTIMQQVRHAYWLALGAQQMEDRFLPLLKEVNNALRDAGTIESERLRSPIEALTYKKMLLEIMKQLEAFRDELMQAKMRLASLINAPPGETIKLALPDSMDKPKLPENCEEMEKRALYMRPELMEAHYNERISILETRKAIVRMLPGIEITGGRYYDDNSFYVWNNWYQGGLRVTWNLLNLLSGPAQLEASRAQTEIAGTHRLALSMAILTQVYLAYQDFQSKERQYDLAKQLLDVDAGIYRHTRNAMLSGTQNRLNEIRSAISALMAEFRNYQHYASLQNAYGQIVATVGVDPLPEEVRAHDVKTISEAILLSRNKPWKPIPMLKE